MLTFYGVFNASLVALSIYLKKKKKKKHIAETHYQDNVNFLRLDYPAHTLQWKRYKVYTNTQTPRIFYSRLFICLLFGKVTIFETHAQV